MSNEPKITPEKDIFDAMQMAALPPDEQEQLLLDLNEHIFKGALVRIMDHMNEKNRATFQELLDSDAPEDKIDAFLEAHVPDVDKLVAETIEEMNSDILAVMGDSAE